MRLSDEEYQEYVEQRARWEQASREAIDDGLRQAVAAYFDLYGFCGDPSAELSERMRSVIAADYPEEWALWLARSRRVKARIKPNLRKQVFERDAYRCVRCGAYQDLCVDHIYPESKGGPTELENLQTLCRPCNTAKGARVDE